MRSARWRIFITWGVLLSLLDCLPGKQTLSARIPDKRATQKRFQLPQSHSTRRLRRRALAKNIGEGAGELTLTGPERAFEGGGGELALTGSESHVGGGGREISLAVPERRYGAITPVDSKRLPSSDLLRGIPKDLKIVDVLSHEKASKESIKYGTSTQSHTNILGQRYIQKTTSMQIESKVEHNMLLQTERDGVTNFLRLHRTIDGTRPGAEVSQTSIHQQLQGRGETNVDLLGFVENRRKEGVPEPVISGFIQQLADEAGGVDNLRNKPYHGIDVYLRWEDHIEDPKQHLALPSTSPGEHEKPDSAATEADSFRTGGPTLGPDGKKPPRSKEKLERASARAEADLFPLHRKKGPDDNFIIQPDGTREKQKIMTFRAFKVLLKGRAKQNDAQMAKFHTWINENHQASLGKVEDRDWFPLDQLFYNFIAWLKVEEHAGNESHFLQAWIKSSQEADASENLMYYYMYPRLNELLELSELTKVQKKYFKPTVSFTPATKNLRFISRGKNPRSEQELRNPFLTEEEFEKYVSDWKKSSKPSDYHYERFAEFVSDGIKKIATKSWSGISQFFKKVGDRLGIKRPQKQKSSKEMESLLESHREGPKIFEDPNYLEKVITLQEHLKLHEFSPVEEKYFKKALAKLLEEKPEVLSGLDLQKDDLGKLPLDGNHFMQGLEVWKKAPKEGRYHVERFAEKMSKNTASSWKRMCESIAELFRKLKRGFSKKDSAPKIPKEESTEGKKLL